MKTAAMTFILTVFISLTASFIAGDACNDVPSMTWDDACLKACNETEQRYNLCKHTLQSGPDTAEVTVYALIAARFVKLKYEDTMAGIDQLLGAWTIAGDERVAVDRCKEEYAGARSLMATVADQMSGCDFTTARQEYLDAQSGVVACQNGLSPFQGLPLVAMVSADLDLTVVAYELGALIVGR